MRGPEVLVIGAGIAGLTSAVRLLESGRRVTVVSDQPAEATTSFLAPGAWLPAGAQNGEQALALSAATLAALSAEAAAPGTAVVMRETLMVYRTEPERPWWAAAIPDGVEVADPAGLPTGYSHGLRFRVPQALMPEYLPQLIGRVQRLGGTVVAEHMPSLAAAAERAVVVVNCSGLAARELAGDDAVFPIRGQIVRVVNPGLHVSLRDEAHPEGRAYVHPRRDDCVLGGTAEAGSWDLRPDPATSESILRRCAGLAPELEGARVLEHQVGLRPGRHQVRLEVEPEAVGEATVIHNYGHGGAGVTLSWGCADRVVALLELSMAGLIYSAISSLDGCPADPEARFDPHRRIRS